MSTKLEEIRALQEAYREKVASAGRESLAEVFAGYKQQKPELKSISWVQYTPYFNDGDPCEFRVGDFYHLLEGDGETDSIWDQRYLRDEKIDLSILRGIDDVFCAAFGDHAKVTVTFGDQGKIDFDVEECEHE